MRTIKFKAWDKELKKMKYPKGIELSEFKLIEEEYPEWNPENIIWLEWTGLKDKNDKEIFEGDILKFEYVQTFSEVEEVGCVEWNEDGFWEIMVDNKGTSVAIFDTNVEEREVIGNIYENPELLGKG